MAAFKEFIQNPYYGDLRIVRDVKTPAVEKGECPNKCGKLKQSARFVVECEKCGFSYSAIGRLA